MAPQLTGGGLILHRCATLRDVTRCGAALTGAEAERIGERHAQEIETERFALEGITRMLAIASVRKALVCLVNAEAKWCISKR
jgi:hypothetical protein